MRQKIGILFVVSFCVLFVFCGEVYSQIWYVDAAKPAGGDGTSWPTAFNAIQSAINAASTSWTECQPPTDQIWVKQGTYTLAAELTLGKTVILYGGFPSFYISPTLAQRKPSVYITTINGNDVTRCMTITAYSIIDGFTFTGGYAAASDGGALSIVAVGSIDCSPDPTMMLTISNCKFTENFASLGGAVYASHCSAKFEDCIFSLNSSDSGGGAVYHTNCYDSEHSGLYFDRCTFCQNVNNGYSIYGGGAILGDSSYDEIINCLFYQNYSAFGGAITYANCYSVIKNSTIVDNEAGSGGAIYNRYAAPKLTNCILWNEESADEIHEGGDTSIVTYSDVRGGFTGAGNINVDPVFVGSPDYHLMPNSLCIDTGTNAGAPTIDIEDNSRPVDGNNDGSAITDMGAYEVAYADLVIQSVSLNPANPQVGQPVTITVVVRNQGVADTDTFRVDWYANRSLPPTAGEYGEAYQSFSSLSSGATVTMTRTYTYSSVGSFSMYAQVDSMANVEESNEDNNVYGPGFVRVIDGTLLDFNIQPESYNVSTWFGGDDGSTKCNTGVGQSMITTRDAQVTTAGFRFTQRFDYANNPEGIGHAVTLYLNVRDSTGSILKTVSKFVSARFTGGWVDFDLGTDFWMEADTTYIFTCYLYQGEYNELKSDACGQTLHPWPTLTGYHAVVKSVPADMETWSNWSTRTYDFNFHLAGQYVEPYPGDVNGDGHVNLTDLRQYAENWMLTDCVMPSWCQNCDFNWNGVVRLEDFNILSSFWDKTYFDYDDLDRAAIVLLYDQMSGDNIDGSAGNEFKVGTYFVYLTNSGRYGKFIVEGWNILTYALTIGLTTYNSDGSVYSTKTGLVIPLGSYCELDKGLETSVDSEFYWEQGLKSKRYLNPQDSAVFKLMYREP